MLLCVAVNSFSGQSVRYQRQQRGGYQELVQVAGSCQVAFDGASWTR